MFDFVIPFIILILVVVFIHEYGHYYFARRYGVGVTDFSIGFGREIFGWNDKSGTRWKICWIPLGGYVKFFGDRNVFSQADQEELLKQLKITNAQDPQFVKIGQEQRKLSDEILIIEDSLDALANRFEISGYDRSFHGALLDANILADVYIHLTGGQSKFDFMSSNMNPNSDSEVSELSIDLDKYPIPKIVVSKEDMLANDQRVAAINSKRDLS